MARPEIKVAENAFVVPDPKARVVTVWMIVHAGCRDEERGQCRGLSHYLEHLMFLGRGAQHDANTSLFFAAGQTNAFTSMIATSYYQTLPAREGQVVADLDRLFELFSGRLRELDPPEDAARRERNVVMQEFNFRRAGGFRARFNNEINALLQPDHPVSQPVIGAREDIEAYTLERARAFHDRWYARNNATFVVYGPVTAEDVKAMMAKYVDPLPEKPIPKRGWLSTRRVFAPLDVVKSAASAEMPRAEVQFEKIVRFEDPDPERAAMAGLILSDFLNSQIAGSLSEELEEKARLVTGPRISRTPLGDGVLWFTLTAALADGVAPEAVKAAFEAYLRELAASGVSAATVERLKRRRAAEMADIDRDPKRALSALTNWFSGNGEYADWLARADRLAAVTPETIRPLIEAMAGPGRQAFGVLLPEQGAGK